VTLISFKTVEGSSRSSQRIAESSFSSSLWGNKTVRCSKARERLGNSVGFRRSHLRSTSQCTGTGSLQSSNYRYSRSLKSKRRSPTSSLLSGRVECLKGRILKHISHLEHLLNHLKLQRTKKLLLVESSILLTEVFSKKELTLLLRRLQRWMKLLQNSIIHSKWNRVELPNLRDHSAIKALWSSVLYQSMMLRIMPWKHLRGHQSLEWSEDFVFKMQSKIPCRHCKTNR
jgi:hypothetical protein